MIEFTRAGQALQHPWNRDSSTADMEGLIRPSERHNHRKEVQLGLAHTGRTSSRNIGEEVEEYFFTRRGARNEEPATAQAVAFDESNSRWYARRSRHAGLVMASSHP